MALPDKQSYAGLAGELADYAPVVDPTTDLPAEASDELRADAAAITRMIGRAYVAFSISGITPTVDEHDAVWGNDDSIKPVVTRTGAGHYLVTWPATVVDARGITHSLNLRRGWPSMNTPAYSLTCDRVSPNSFNIKTYSIAALALADPAATLVLAVL